MENKENVYDLNESAGQPLHTETGAGEVAPPENHPTAPSKFKDVDALTRAYESLQAEFTRRSQRLRALEKWAENLGETNLSRGGSGVEKLRKNAQVRRAEKRAFDAFVADMGRGKDLSADENGAHTALPKPENGDKPLEIGAETERSVKEERNDGVQAEKLQERVQTESENAGDMQKKKEELPAVVNVGGGTSVVESVEKDLSADALYGQVLRNEEVRLKIIGEYLASVGKTAPPLTLGGVGAFATPPRRAESIGDAGNRALLYLKNKKEQTQN